MKKLIWLLMTMAAYTRHLPVAQAVTVLLRPSLLVWSFSLCHYQRWGNTLWTYTLGSTHVWTGSVSRSRNSLFQIAHKLSGTHFLIFHKHWMRWAQLFILSLFRSAVSLAQLPSGSPTALLKTHQPNTGILIFTSLVIPSPFWFFHLTCKLDAITLAIRYELLSFFPQTWVFWFVYTACVQFNPSPCAVAVLTFNGHLCYLGIGQWQRERRQVCRKINLFVLVDICKRIEFYDW